MRGGDGTAWSVWGWPESVHAEQIGGGCRNGLHKEERPQKAGWGQTGWLIQGGNINDDEGQISHCYRGMYKHWR